MGTHVADDGDHAFHAGADFCAHQPATRRRVLDHEQKFQTTEPSVESRQDHDIFLFTPAYLHADFAPSEYDLAYHDDRMRPVQRLRVATYCGIGLHDRGVEEPEF